MTGMDRGMADHVRINLKGQAGLLPGPFTIQLKLSERPRFVAANLSGWPCFLRVTALLRH